MLTKKIVYTSLGYRAIYKNLAIRPVLNGLSSTIRIFSANNGKPESSEKSSDKTSRKRADNQNRIREIKKQELTEELAGKLQSYESAYTFDSDFYKVTKRGVFSRNGRYIFMLMIVLSSLYMLYGNIEFRENLMSEKYQFFLQTQKDEKEVYDMVVCLFAKEYRDGIINFDKKDSNMNFLEENFLESFQDLSEKYFTEKQNIKATNQVVLDSNVPMFIYLKNEYQILTKIMLEEVLADPNLQKALVILEACNNLYNFSLQSNSLSTLFGYKNMGRKFAKRGDFQLDYKDASKLKDILSVSYPLAKIVDQVFFP